jgi:hypothetical protein
MISRRQCRRNPRNWPVQSASRHPETTPRNPLRRQVAPRCSRCQVDAACGVRIRGRLQTARPARMRRLAFLPSFSTKRSCSGILPAAHLAGHAAPGRHDSGRGTAAAAGLPEEPLHSAFHGHSSRAPDAHRAMSSPRSGWRAAAVLRQHQQPISRVQRPAGASHGCSKPQRGCCIRSSGFCVHRHTAECAVFSLATDAHGFC